MVVSNGEDLPNDSNGNNGGGDDDNDGDDDDQAINLPDYAPAATAANKDANDEGMPRKTLVTATIRKKMDAANADIPKGGASNGPMLKLRQYSGLTFEAMAPPRSGCS